MENHSPQPVADNETPVQERQGFRLRNLLFSVLLGFVLLLAGVVYWAGKTESGTKVLFSALHYLTAGSLTANDIHGSVGDDLEVAQLSFHTATIKIEARGIHLIWQPLALWHQQFLIDRFYVTSLLVASKSDNSPATMPQRLALPLDLSVKDMALGELVVADLLEHDQQRDVVKLSALTGQLSFHQGQYQTNVSLKSPWGDIKVRSLNLDATLPYALQGDATWSGQVLVDKPAVDVAVAASGNLQSLKLKLQAQLAQLVVADGQNKDHRISTDTSALRGSASATLSPFGQQVVTQLDIDIHHLNPAVWAAFAPSADLNVVLSAHPDAGQKNKTDLLIGQLHAVNHAAAPFNMNGLPLTQVDTQFVLQRTDLRLSGLQIAVAGNGSVRGVAHIDWQTADPRADARIEVSNVDLVKIDEHLRQTKITGEVTAQTHEKENIQVQAQLHDVGTQLNIDLNYDMHQQLLNLKQIKLVSQDSHIDSQGDISFAGNQAFHLKGVVSNFNPAKWLAVPSGRLNADFSSTGQLLPDLSLSATVPHLMGQYAGKTVQGNMDLQWHARQVQVHQLDLHWGSNAVNMQGAWGGVNDALKVQLDAPQLAELNELTALLSNNQLALDGDVKANLVLQGAISEPAGQLTMQSSHLQVSKLRQIYSVSDVAGKVSLSPAADGVVEGDIVARHLRADASSIADPEDKIEQLTLHVNGHRTAHQISVALQLPEQRTISAQFSGGLRAKSAGKADPQGWDGRLQSLLLHGKTDARLMNSSVVSISPDKVSMGSMYLESSLGNFSLEQLEWTPQALKTNGHVNGAKVTDLVNLFKPQYALTGGLKLNADWNIQLGDIARGEVNIQRQSGDLRFNDPDGTGTPIPLGISHMQAQLRIGGLVAGTNGQRMALTLDADGTRLGQLHLKGDTLLEKQDGAWTVLSSAPLNAKVSAVLPDLEWVGSWINPGIVLKGKLNLDATVAGQLRQPHYHVDLAGRELELAFASEGLLLPNGVLDAQIDDAHLKLNRLQFSNKVSMLPQHDQFKGWDAIGQRGEFNASGELDIGKETGSITAQWQQFPLLQRKDRWLQISGQASIVEANSIWSLNGKVLADGAYFKLPKLPPPSLSSDVHVTRKVGKLAAKNADTPTTKKGLKTRVDVSFDMGSRFVFVGRGLDTGLTGSLRLRSIDGSPLQATGSINTVKGFYEGYGQQLTIDRGILNFQGPPANPGLNIRALRQGLAVEAGVEVVGTVVAPQVRLVSEPDVPDAEKLTWLVLGRGSDQLAGGDASLLMSAATAIFGGDGSRNVPKDIVQGLGFDEFSIGNSSGAPTSHVPGRTVAGNTSTASSTATSNDQVVSVGKHLMPGLVLAVERGLGDASGAVKLSWQLTRRITIIGRTGSESAVDVNYTFSFN
ncbi:translocation/assembly module TamB domain-containing protein [Undibacterium sp. RuRC25W]|uniref:translocation/assembly module TamB domain-containing protein n=1 Tax=Undibacterium sp. RuRC25W TaxID=3413047 RepID=UPI003BF44E80